MKYLPSIGLVVTISFSVTAQVIPNASLLSKSNQITFTENKGQVGDQNHQPVPEVLFSGKTGGLVFHLRTDGISYQQTRIDTWKKEEREVVGNNEEKEVLDQLTVYRTDLRWIGSNPEVKIEKGKAKPDQTNYYHAVCPDGVTGVRSYETVTYKNIYEGIDLKWYDNGGQLEYDFVVQPGRDYKKIKWEIKGAESLSISEAGELVIQAPLGEIREAAPVAFQGRQEVPVSWQLNENVVSFDIANYNENLSLTIDPLVREWGTFYGGTDEDELYACIIGKSDEVYIAGYTRSNSNIATTGSHQSTLSGTYDAFLVKFNAAGERQWATYYGGSSGDVAYFCEVDEQGDIFWGGYTFSASAIATAGSYQSSLNGTRDGFLVKCNGSGVRQWATYYGGPGIEYAHSLTLDNAGNLYMTGQTNSTSQIASGSVFQTSYGGGDRDAFLVKFDNNGNLLWGTYFGGTSTEYGLECSLDSETHIYLAGEVEDTATSGSLATPGSHQSMYSGYKDGFLAKFDVNGQRIWSTYYGGTKDDFVTSCQVDANSNVYIVGSTTSETGIATAGSHQENLGSNGAAYVVKFNSSGSRLWGTYFGGNGNERADCSVIEPFYSNLYIAGYTSSTDLPTSGTYQDTMGGVHDGFLARFSGDGNLVWSTYYGGIYSDNVTACSMNSDASVIYLAGVGRSPSLVTPGAHQQSLNGSDDCFLAKFQQPVGIEESNSNHNFLIYPNPTSGSITIDLRESISDVNVTITNTAGQVIHSGIYRGKRLIQLDITAAPGVYFVRVSDGERTGVRKLVVR